MLLMPPGSAKSTYATLLFPAWWIAQHPRTSVLTTCNTAALAERFGRGVRSLLTDHALLLDIALQPGARAADRFITSSGTDYYGTGVQSTIMGRRADLVLIDDPIRSSLEAGTRAARDKLWDWYCSELVTRLKPNARIVLVMTRWHQDDLAGRLLSQGDWRTIRLPALAEEGDELAREPGEALWPDWEDRDALLAKQATLGEFKFAAMFQQSPLPETGRTFDLTNLQFVDSPPEGKAVRAWDFAGSIKVDNDPDWTVGLKLIRDECNGYVIQDIRRARVPARELAPLIEEVARCDGPAVTIGLPRDPGQAGLFQVSALTRILAGYRVVSSREVGSKQARAEPVASQMAVGNISIVRAAWNDSLIDELALFPHGKKDDQVDALARAFEMLVPCEATSQFVNVSILGR